MVQPEYNTLLEELAKLHKRYELSKTITPDYFEPGMMEYLDKSEGVFCEETKSFLVRFEVKGTRYDGRTEQIEKVKLNDPIEIVRDADNIYNSNNFRLFTQKGQDVGNFPADLCNALAPLYDGHKVEFTYAKVSYVEPLSVRSRHAKQAILFVELKGLLL